MILHRFSLVLFLTIGAVVIQPLSFCFAKSSKISVAVFDSPAGHEHSKRVINLLKSRAHKCNNLEVQLFSIYDQQGNIDSSRFLNSLRSIDRSISLVHVSWNLPASITLDPIANEFSRISSVTAIPVVAASGESQDRQKIADSIDNTVMGQAKNIILVGELDQKGKLSSASFFGDKIVAAFPAPESYRGSSFSSVLMSAEILNSICQNKKRNWYESIANTKRSSSKQWPQLKDYF